MAGSGALIGISTGVAPAALVTPAALGFQVTVPSAALFLGFMVAVGYGIGRIMGDEYQLMPFLRRRSKAEDPEALAVVHRALVAVERGEPIPEQDRLLSMIDGPAAVDRLFGGDRLEPLLTVLERPVAAGDPSKKGRRDDVYALLAHIASMSAQPLRVGLAAAMARALLRHRHLAPHLIEVARHDPDIWNDVQGLVENAANHDPGVRRFLDNHANDSVDFVRRASDLYLNEMVRFRRLCEDSALAGIGAVVQGELASMIEREFTVLEVSGAPSKRFVWMVSQPRAVKPLITEERIEVLIDSAQRGAADACALAAQLALVTLNEDGDDQFIDEVLDALGYGASRHLAAADALLGLFSGIRPKGRAKRLSPRQDAVRRRVYDVLQRAGSSSFEVRAMLGTHGIRGEHYPELIEDEPSHERSSH